MAELYPNWLQKSSLQTFSRFRIPLNRMETYSASVNKSYFKNSSHYKDLSKAAWSVIITKPQFEKKVYKRFLENDIKTFLPLSRELRIWSDRKKWVEIPLFRGYVFVKITPQEHNRILRINGVVNFIRFGDSVAVVPEKQINTIRKFINYSPQIEVVNESINNGDYGIIKQGFLLETKVKFIRYQGKNRAIVKIESLGKSLLLNIQASHVESCIS